MSISSHIRHQHCPHCRSLHFVKRGTFYKKITKAYIPRYRCLDCKKSFSTRTGSRTYRQKRPDINSSIFHYLCSGVTLRRTAFLLGVSYSTVYTKFLWLSNEAKLFHEQQKFIIKDLEFDEMHSIEHTKLKPLIIALAVSAVSSKEYLILNIKVGTIPATGSLAHLSRKKYGPRVDESSIKVKELLSELNTQLKHAPHLIKSDEKPSYQKIVKDIFGSTAYKQYSAKENKEKKREQKYHNHEKRIFDPLFAVNHRCAKLRADIKRLTRRSWCTTKLKENLEKHLYLYIAHNNKYAFC